MIVPVDVDGTRYWYKELPPLFASEGRLTALVHGRCPVHVPHVCGFGEDWLVMEHVSAMSLRPPDAGAGVAVMARLHIQSTDWPNDDLATLPDRRLDKVMERVRAVLNADGLLSPTARARMMGEYDRLERLCRDVEASPWPDTIVHGDLNADNMIHTAQGWVILDWSDAALSCPLVDVGYAAMMAPDGTGERVIDEFMETWGEVLPLNALAFGRKAARALAALYQVDTDWRLMEGLEGLDGRKDMEMWLDRAIGNL